MRRKSQPEGPQSETYKRYLSMRPEIKKRIDSGDNILTIAGELGFNKGTLGSYIRKDSELYDIFIKRKSEYLFCQDRQKLTSNGVPVFLKDNECVMSINELPGIAVSEKGYVYAYVDENKEYYLIKPILRTPDPYYELMNKSGGQVRVSEAQLVATCFLTKDHDYQSIIFHLDGNVNNNSKENLIWISGTENRLLLDKKRVIRRMTERYGFSYREAVESILHESNFKKDHMCTDVPKDGEEWKDISGFTGYQISNRGKVRNFDSDSCVWRQISQYWRIEGREDQRELYVMMKSDKGRYIAKKVSLLVASAFLPWQVKNSFIIHKDGDAMNNDSGNLILMTRYERDRQLAEADAKKRKDSHLH